MSKFHINKHGVPAPCKAKPGNCPFGGEESHFDSREEAQAYVDKSHEKKFGLLSGIKNSLGIGRIKEDNIDDYRAEYYKRKVDIPAEEKLNDLVYVVNMVEEKEQGTMGESHISKSLENIHSFTDIDSERRFNDALNIVKQESKNGRNKYFDYFDGELKVNSSEGFIPKGMNRKTIAKIDNADDYRTEYYNRSVDIPAEEKLDNLVYAVNMVEEKEQGTMGESRLSKSLENIHSFTDIDSERRFNDALNIVKQESENGENKYLDYFDKELKVNSLAGFKHR